MPAKDGRLHNLEVPVIVELGRRRLKLGEVMNMLPGTIIDLEKDADHELELLVNNQVVATGTAVKVGENFGLRLVTVGSRQHRGNAASRGSGNAPAADSAVDNATNKDAEQILAGQDV